MSFSNHGKSNKISQNNIKILWMLCMRIVLALTQNLPPICPLKNHILNLTPNQEIEGCPREGSLASVS